MIGKYVTVICECEQIHETAYECEGESSAEHTVRQVRLATRADGWRKHGGKDFCPHCSEAGCWRMP